MVYYISWSSQCVVAWFPGSEEVSCPCLLTKRLIEPKLYPAALSSPGCGLLGQRDCGCLCFESSGSCVGLNDIFYLYLDLFEIV